MTRPVGVHALAWLLRLYSLRTAIGLLFLTLIAPTARAQFTIDWFTVDGGGVMNVTGGTFTLSGTVGQPDAGTLGGGSLVGGFWAVLAPLPPILTISRSGPNVIISWPSPSTGFVLQETPDLSASPWNNVAQAPSDNGLSKSVIVTGPFPPKFYRLSNP